MANIKNYAARYVVPFYFDYENNGYTRILEYLRNNKNLNNDKMGLPGDCSWVESGFWKKYKSESQKQSEMDIYTYLLQIFEEYPENDTKYATNLGCSFVLKTNGSLFNLQYNGALNEGIVSFRCSDLGLLIFRNGIGFIWYDIEFSKIPSISAYIKFQHDFKELARTHNKNFIKKTGKDSYEVFCLGNWLNNIINVDQFGIRFWAERETTLESNELKKLIPDKALLFQYVFIDETTDSNRMELAFQIANGYDEKYISPQTLVNDIYQPFGNTCFYTSKTGTSYIVSNNDSNETFFMDNFKEKFVRDYFFIYVLLLYQTYSCAHYSRMLTQLPAEKEHFEKDSKYVDNLESLDNQINLFLVKSVYESVSNIQHQNGAYKYGKKALSIEEDIKSLTIGLEALREIEKEKVKNLEDEKEKIEQDKNEKKDRALNNGLIIFGFLVVISAALDALTLVNWLKENILVIEHFIALGVVALLTIFMLVVFLVNMRRK